MAILLLNAGDKTQDVSFSLKGVLPALPVLPAWQMEDTKTGSGSGDRARAGARVGAAATVTVLARDLWQHKELGTVAGDRYTAKQLASNDSQLITLRYAKAPE